MSWSGVGVGVGVELGCGSVEYLPVTRTCACWIGLWAVGKGFGSFVVRSGCVEFSWGGLG